MSIKRSTRCRLRVESLEGREVPAGVTTIDPTLPEDPGTDSAVVSDPTPTDPAPSDPGGEVTVTNELDGTPETQQVDLSVFATVDKIKPSLGDVITIRFTMMNNSELPASGAKLTATLPAGLTVLSSQTDAGNYDATTGEWTAGIIFPGEPATMTIKARVIDAAEQAVSASIFAADQTDPVATNNAASLTITPVLAGVSVSQTASQSVATLNGTIIFTVRLTNSGPGIARNLVVQETLPAGLNWVRVGQPDKGIFDVKSKTWKLGWLMPGTSANLQFVAQVNKTGRLDAMSVLTATGIDETRSKLQASASVVGTKTNSPATWTYTGPGNQPSPVRAAVIKTTQPVGSSSFMAQLAAYLLVMKKLGM